MYENSHSWRKRIRLQELVTITEQELESGKSFEEITEMLEEEMKSRWNLVVGTRKQYLDTIRKVLDNQYVLINHTRI